MADIGLTPRSSLQNLPKPQNLGFALSEAAPVSRFIFRGGADARGSCSIAFRLELPQKLGLAIERQDRAALWLGPDEWLLLASGTDAEPVSMTIAASLGETPYSLVDVSHRQLGIIVQGANATRALSAGCALDLRQREFPIGFATRTLFDKTEIVLWRRQAELFHVEVWRSFALHLTAALAEAASRAPRR